jgi:hypothetical protein
VADEGTAVKNRTKTAKARPRGKPFEAGAPSANPIGRPKAKGLYINNTYSRCLRLGNI